MPILDNIIQEKTAIRKLMKMVTYEGGEFKDPDGNSVTPVGSQGTSAGLRYNFSATTTDADPGQGVFRLNHATLSSATAMYIDNLMVGGGDVGAFIQSWVNGSKVLIRANDSTDSSFAIFTVGAVVDSTGYRTVPLTYVSGTSFTDAESCVIQYYVAGANGTNGTNGTDGTDGTNGTDGASAYVYTAYASAIDGTGFTMTFDAGLAYRAVKTTTSPIASPVVGDFAGLWYKATGTDGFSGSDGAQGHRAGMTYVWGSSTGNADPTSGKIRLSSATMTPGTAMTLRVNDVDAQAVNMESNIQLWSSGDILEMKSNDNAGITYMQFRVDTPAVDATGYWNTAVTVLGGALPVNNGEVLSIQRTPRSNFGGLRFKFDVTATSGDPGSGNIRASGTNFAAITNLYVDDEAVGALNVQPFVATWIQNGLIYIQSNAGTAFGIVRITSVTDSGTYYTIAVTALAGTTIAANSELSLIYIPPPNVSWDGTDLLDAGGVKISDPFTYATLADVPAASTMLGKAVIVKSLAGNTGGAPTSIYADAAKSKWEILNGRAVIDRAVPNLFVTSVASTFVGSYTMATAAAGAQTKITATGAHGLTTAVCITAGDTYIRIQPGSGTGWTPGLYRITAITLDTTGTDITILHPFTSGMGQPIIGKAGTPFDVIRVRMPAMSSVGGALVTLTNKHDSVATSARSLSAEIVALNGAVGSGYAIWSPAANATADDIIHRVQFGFNNIGATNIQHRIFKETDLDGWLTVNTSDVDGAVGAVQTNTTFEMLFVYSIAANDKMCIRNYTVEGYI